jgi:DNA polymerase III subunit epsilon
MRVLGLDFETTGLDTSKDRITEAGIVLWEVETKRPLTALGIFYYDETYPKLSDEITRLTGITDAMLKEFGTAPAANLEWLEGYCQKHAVEHIIAHNGENFDKPLLQAELKRHHIHAPFLSQLPWIDTKTDLPFATEPASRRLNHLALDAGFINPFAHRAVFDVLTMCRVLSNYDFNQVVEYSKIPFITVRAMVEYADRQLAKDQRYTWEKLGDRTFQKSWVKRIKENKFEDEKKICKFPVVRIE